jgi:hypothetical protein
MAVEATNNLIASWRIGKILLSVEGAENLQVVGRDNEGVQLAKRTNNQKGIQYTVDAYPAKIFFLHIVEDL